MYLLVSSSLKPFFSLCPYAEICNLTIFKPKNMVQAFKPAKYLFCL